MENVCDIVVDLEPFMPFGIGQAAPPNSGRAIDGRALQALPHSGERSSLSTSTLTGVSCAPRSLPDFDELAERYPGEVIVLGISLGKTEALCREYAAKKQIRHPIIYDGPWRSSRLREALRVCDVPLLDHRRSAGKTSPKLTSSATLLARHVETLINSTAS